MTRKNPVFDFNYAIGPVNYHISLDQDEIVYDVVSLHQRIPLNRVKEIAISYDSILEREFEAEDKSQLNNLKGIGQILVTYTTANNSKETFSSIKVDFSDQICQTLLTKIAQSYRGNYRGTLSHQQARKTILRNCRRKNPRRFFSNLWNNF